MEVDFLLNRKIKMRKKLLVIRDVMMILIAFLFILIAFTINFGGFNSGSTDTARIQYGLFSLALMGCGTALIITVYNRNKRHTVKLLSKSPEVNKVKK